MEDIKQVTWKEKDKSGMVFELSDGNHSWVLDPQQHISFHIGKERYSLYEEKLRRPLLNFKTDTTVQLLCAKNGRALFGLLGINTDLSIVKMQSDPHVADLAQKIPAD